MSKIIFEHLVSTKHYAKHSTCRISFNPDNSPQTQALQLLPYYTDETEAEKGSYLPRVAW